MDQHWLILTAYLERTGGALPKDETDTITTQSTVKFEKCLHWKMSCQMIVESMVCVCRLIITPDKSESVCLCVCVWCVNSSQLPKECPFCTPLSYRKNETSAVAKQLTK